VTGDEVRRVPGAAHISCTVEMAPVVVGTSVQVPRATQALQQRLTEQQHRHTGGSEQSVAFDSGHLLSQGAANLAGLSPLQHSRGSDVLGLPGRGEALSSTRQLPPLLPGQQHILQQAREVQNMQASAAAAGSTAPLVGLGSGQMPWAGQPSIIDVAVIDEIQVRLVDSGSWKPGLASQPVLHLDVCTSNGRTDVAMIVDGRPASVPPVNPASRPHCPVCHPFGHGCSGLHLIFLSHVHADDHRP
jgi:hypothetical protein